MWSKRTSALVRSLRIDLRGHEEIRPGVGVRVEGDQTRRQRIHRLRRDLIVRGTAGR